MRMALGAQESQVSWLILRQGMFQLALGTGIGLAGAYATSRVLAATRLIQVGTSDPVTFGAITLLLVSVVAAACLIPARRASRLDPLVALRAD